ncbi:MAG: hypothetical protein ACP6KW_10175 [Candidatus Thorarchaeota archaeon]
MQDILERLFVGALVATLIVVMMLVLGASIGYREEIRRRRLNLYAKVSVLVVTLAVSIYLLSLGALPLEDVLIMVTVLTLLVLCTDWSSRTDTKQNNRDSVGEEELGTHVLTAQSCPNLSRI